MQRQVASPPPLRLCGLLVKCSFITWKKISDLMIISICCALPSSLYHTPSLRCGFSPFPVSPSKSTNSHQGSFQHFPEASAPIGMALDVDAVVGDNDGTS